MAGSWHSCLQEEGVHFLLSLLPSLITACSAGKSRAYRHLQAKQKKTQVMVQITHLKHSCLGWNTWILPRCKKKKNSLSSASGIPPQSWDTAKILNNQGLKYILTSANPYTRLTMCQTLLDLLENTMVTPKFNGFYLNGGTTGNS